MIANYSSRESNDDLEGIYAAAIVPFMRYTSCELSEKFLIQNSRKLLRLYNYLC